MAEPPTSDSPAMRAFAQPEPGRLIGRGHTAGDFLEAWAWDLLEEAEGHLRLRAPLPDHVKNPRGQLFGGFTPTYVDLVALFTTRAGPERLTATGNWLATTSMHVDYFEPITGPTFEMDSRVVKRRGRTILVHTRFEQDGDLAVLAATTMRELAWDRALGDA